MTTTLRAAIDEYLSIRERTGKADNTMRLDRSLLPRLAEHLGNPTFEDLTPEQVRDFFYGTGGIMDIHVTRVKGQSLRAAVGPTTHNHYRSRLAVFFSFCRSTGTAQRGDYLKFVDPLPEMKRKRMQPAPSVLLSLLDQAECAMHRAYLATAVNTACRASELQSLKVGDVNFSRSELFVTVVKTKEEDDMPLTADLERELRVWFEEYADLLGRPLEDDDYLFPARSGNQIKTHYFDEKLGCRVYERTPLVYHPDRPVERTEKIVKAALEKLGLPTRYEGTHTLRRAVARAYFDQLSEEVGYDAALRTVSALLHHRNMSTTERYLGLSTETKRRDQTMKGRAFLTGMVTQSNVVPLRAAK
ncbi:tyrosine-type recombinase/integrase [Streptomyces sp. MI02-2A]|uniref:tyrosine-type recombinase/integrase n=1 Tax=Streptomyces sp. MI02-2A TaxID=3028688 RepID=UPI0029A996EA|nr:tyrosine-type recombinase/integrase [Streptomyces sp. MI02-2A]MDX3260677.1 tyrosine-type recombinase/integrase [Streptomyces sp. MI02-2A]